jgi:hypothetical protein
MSQRNSEYERKERDLYETPAWVTEALLPHVRPVETVWEPAAGSGKMVGVHERFAGQVIATDIETGQDFLEARNSADAIITNPPYALATEFIERALSLTASRGLVAMLLRTDFDHARTRQHLFQHPAFAKKLVLTKRIKWFEDSKGQPSFNHAWFMWDWQHQGWPILAYGP